MTEDHHLERPLFIVGVGRSGSSVFHEMLSEHPRLAWLSELCERSPARPERNRALLRSVDVPGLGRLLRRRFPPSEAYAFWDRLFPGFSVPCRDLSADDVSRTTRERVLGAFRSLLTGRKDRLLVKITGWPRVGFLDAIFEDARFVHVVRDGRAVANSLLQVPWWWGWRGPHVWRLGLLPEPYAQEWERHGRSFVALAAIEWKIVLDAMDRARRHVPSERLFEVRFEELCEDPEGTTRRVLDFAGLDWNDRFHRTIVRYDVRNTNEKWRRQLTPRQQEILQEVLGDRLARLGYHGTKRARADMRT